MARKQTKKPTKLTSRQKVVGRFFRGLPVVDATEPLRVIVNREDIRHAKRLDPNNCVFAQACRRLYNSHAVLVLRRVAYIELPDERGHRYVYRYVITEDTFNAIATFDKTGEAPEGGFIFNAPTKATSMEGHKAYAKKYQKRLKEGHKPKRRQVPAKKRNMSMIGVRDGRGKLGINYAF